MTVKKNHLSKDPCPRCKKPLVYWGKHIFCSSELCHFGVNNVQAIRAKHEFLFK